jgi:hypothetical protein
MSEEQLCRFSLIFAPWLVRLILIVGALLFLLGAMGLATLRARGTISIGGKTLTALNIFPVIMVVIGFPLFLPAALASYQPSARWLGERFPTVVDQADLPVSADLNDKPLGELQTNPTGTYTVRMSPAARLVQLEIASGPIKKWALRRGR